VTDGVFDFAGRAALISGCGSAEGIGFACARLLARLGARVAITSTTDRIEARAEDLRREGATVFAYAADLAHREQALAPAGRSAGGGRPARRAR
jgi:3-oxoacyl-[acyl-carrier protein] reductase